MLETQTPHICKQFLNNIEVKGLRTNYSRAEALLNIQRFILKHIQNFNRVLCDLERAELTVAEVKSQWCMPGIGVINFIYNLKEHHSDNVKILKIIKWSLCASIAETKAFIEVCVYYQIWISEFVHITASIYYLFQNEVLFKWTRCQ